MSTKETKKAPKDQTVSLAGLELLRSPFPEHQISKLPKPTKAQTEEVKANYKAGIRCKLCGAWHHPDVVHLDYVGHAALTDRLLDSDPNWSWEPLALKDGLPAFDSSGGLWIKLTVCGVTRLGYGNAASKTTQDVGSREKEIIGDALRNAAMRFGAALDLWHKGDLHLDDKNDVDDDKKPEAAKPIRLREPEKPLTQTKPQNAATEDKLALGLEASVDMIRRACATGLWTREQVMGYCTSVYKKEPQLMTWKEGKEFLALAAKRTFEEIMKEGEA